MVVIHGVMLTMMLLELARDCPKCARKVIVPQSKKRQTVQCPRCRTSLAPTKPR